MNDPIDRIAWLPADDFVANDYNPNVVFSPELRLLEHSILETGWIQPILVSRDDVIIDGFHRWMLARESVALRERYAGRVPVVRLDLDRPAALMLTVRINRAKGTHTALKMSAIVKELLDEHALDPDTVAKNIGATRAEITLLHQEGVFSAKNIKDYRYSRAWYPVEVRGSKV